ncbi:MAG: hypothetical protein E5X92_05785, partial [Mesorhizobium sp.]
MLTIVINLTFTQIGPNRLAVNKKGAKRRENPCHRNGFSEGNKLFGRRKARLRSAPSASEDGDMLQIVSLSSAQTINEESGKV